MLRYILPTVAFLAFLVLPAATSLDNWQGEGAGEAAAYSYSNWRDSYKQHRNWAFPTLRQEIATIDRTSLNQPFWSACGQPRNYGYLKDTTAAERVNFAVAYWHFLDTEENLTASYYYRHDMAGLDGYRQHDVSYPKCEAFARCWWLKDSVPATGKAAGSPRRFQAIDQKWLQESLLDAGELLYRAHIAGSQGIACDDSPPEEKSPRYLPFFDGGAFIHQQFVIENAGKNGFLRELPERTVLASDSMLAFCQTMADSIKSWWASRAETKNEKSELPARSYCYSDPQGKISIPIKLVEATSFHHGMAPVNLQLEAPIGTDEVKLGDNIHKGMAGSPATTSYDLGAVVDANGNWHGPQYYENAFQYEPTYDCTQSFSSYRFRPAHHAFLYSTDSALTPTVFENGFYGFKRDLTIAIAPRFDWAGSFHEGLAMVCQDGKFGFIDLTGDLVIPPTFEAARSFSQGTAPVKDSISHKWGYIDKSGHFVIAPRFLAAYPFFENRAVVAIGPDEKLPPPTTVNRSSLALLFGMAALDHWQAEVARKNFEKAIALDPGGPFAQQAEVYLRTRVPLRTVPLAAEVEFRMARTNYAEREEQLKMCHQKYPNFEWPSMELADTYGGQGQPKKAIAVLEQVRRINPNYVPALVKMSGMYRQSGELDLAKKVTEEARQISPNDDLVTEQLKALGMK